MLLLLVILASLSQQPSITFRSTSVLCPETKTSICAEKDDVQSRYTVPIAAAQLDQPFAKSSSSSTRTCLPPRDPRRSWDDPNGDYGDDDPTPGYDPADPLMPIGDVPWWIVIGMIGCYLGFKKRFKGNE